MTSYCYITYLSMREHFAMHVYLLHSIYRSIYSGEGNNSFKVNSHQRHMTFKVHWGASAGGCDAEGSPSSLCF